MWVHCPGSIDVIDSLDACWNIKSERVQIGLGIIRKDQNFRWAPIKPIEYIMCEGEVCYGDRLPSRIELIIQCFELRANKWSNCHGDLL